MPAKKRDAPRTTVTIHRVVSLPEELRVAIKRRREERGQKLFEFIRQAVDELDGLVLGIEELSIATAVKKNRRPARLPLDEQTLTRLKRASQRVGLPASTLLLAALNRSANRQRRRRRQAVNE